MATSTKFALLIALLAAALGLEVRADKGTVCTITVNSSDEKEMFRRYLPEDKFQFVELVERGRPDWLASACQRRVRCDVLVISGHFEGTEFFSDQVNVSEFLPVEEMERVSCSESCPGLFSQLKEVYLFGCNTLNAEAANRAAAEIVSSLVRSGHSEADAKHLSRVLNQSHSESNRDGMRRIFANVPVIYGFASRAPVGPTAASTLSRYFQSASSGEIGRGHMSSKLLSHFANNSMTVTSGLRDSDPQAVYRREVCQFFDERLSPAQKLGFVHQILGRNMAEVRMFLEHIEKFSTSITEEERKTPSFARRLNEIARDQVARDRYLAFTRDTDRPQIRARMIQLARSFGWLSPEEERAEMVRMIGDLLAGNAMGAAEVDLVCSLNKEHELDQELLRFELSPSQASKMTHAAALACLGSVEGRDRVLQGLTSPNDEDIQSAQVYLRHRPITDVNELRMVAAGIARMNESGAQVRALDTLARHYLSDRESLDELTRLFPLAKSVSVQRAIAGILIRSDYRAIDKPELISMLHEHRLKSSERNDLIDALIRRLQTP